VAARRLPPLRPRNRKRDPVHRRDPDRGVRREAGVVVAARAVPVLRAVGLDVLRAARMVRRSRRIARVRSRDRSVCHHAAVRRERPAPRPRDRPLRADVALDRAVGALAGAPASARARDRPVDRDRLHRRAGARLPAVPRARAVGRRRAAPASLRPAAASDIPGLAAARDRRRRRARHHDGARRLLRASRRGDLGRQHVLRQVRREPQRAVQSRLGLAVPARAPGDRGLGHGGLRVPRRRRARVVRVRAGRVPEAGRRIAETSGPSSR
jgi:hypothetical protein